MFLWFVAAGVVMPLWLGPISVHSPAVPTLDPWSGLGHVLYGGLLGAVSAGIQKTL